MGVASACSGGSSTPSPQGSVAATPAVAAASTSSHAPWPQSQGGGPTPAAHTSGIALHVEPGQAIRIGSSDLGKSWHLGCPVVPNQLRAVGVRFWGFDRRRHQGVIVVNRRVVRPVQAAFAAMLRAHFPMHRVEPVSEYGGSDNRSMRHDNTSAFNCRYAVNDGPKTWSMHAYGEAIDLDPLENPYRLGGKILPKQGAAYADRSHVRPGMIVAGGVAVDIFDRLGWGWGGRWSSTPDYQHFSTNGR
jgi:hypothetical protein